jgi:hypothetical protein
MGPFKKIGKIAAGGFAVLEAPQVVFANHELLYRPK